MSKITKADLLIMSIDAVADRGLNYGSPEDNFNRIAILWNAWLEIRYGIKNAVYFQLDAIDVAQMCSFIKDARIANQPNHLDSWIDKAGYAACGANIACKEPVK